MLEFLLNNLGTIIVALIVSAIVAAIVAGMVKEKKSGKHSCGGGCSGCPYSGKCHSVEENSSDTQ